jgi:hypothetical protein
MGEIGDGRILLEWNVFNMVNTPRKINDDGIPWSGIKYGHVFVANTGFGLVTVVTRNNKYL